MALFYSHDIIYEALTTGWYEIAEEDPGWDQVSSTPVIRRPGIFFPRIEEVIDEIPVIETGWDQPAPVIVRSVLPINPDDPTTVFQPVVAVAQDQPQFDTPPIVYRLKTFDDDISFVDDVPIIETGWEQAYLPPVVPPIKTPPSSISFVDDVIIVPTEEAFIEPPLVIIRRITPVSTTTFIETVEVVVPPTTTAARIVAQDFWVRES